MLWVHPMSTWVWILTVLSCSNEILQFKWMLLPACTVRLVGCPTRCTSSKCGPYLAMKKKWERTWATISETTNTHTNTHTERHTHTLLHSMRFIGQQVHWLCGWRVGAGVGNWACFPLCLMFIVGATKAWKTSCPTRKGTSTKGLPVIKSIWSRTITEII